MNKRFVFIGLLLIILFIVGTLTFSQNNSVPPITVVPENPLASTTPATTTPIVQEPEPTNYIVDQSYHNKSITLKVGDEFLLDLADDIDWKVTLTNSGIVEQLKTSEALQGTQGIFKAIKAGETTLNAGGGKKCAEGMACILIYAEFTTKIIVK
ncbi:MAG: hypothetical protein V4519_02640 [Patescibacteria group bacterium]